MILNIRESKIGRAIKKLEDSYADPIALGAAFYRKHCTVCHGADLKGNPPTHPGI